MGDVKGVNREYKDRLFKFIFCNPENKEWTLSLYNAMNGSAYTNTDDLTYTTLDDAVYMSMKNDVSFLMADTMNFYEQQSTFNPNMPMRFLIYAGMVYSKYIEENKNYHKYSRKQQIAPTPKCVCFYNGTMKKEDKIILKLSDSFKEDSAPDIEVTVTMLNINYGHNKELIKSCKPLEEYSWFIDKIRLVQSKSKSESLEVAIDIALDELPNDSLIKQFLIDNKAEVKRMCITEYDEERTFAEQREEGREEGAFNMLVDLVKKQILTLPIAAEQAKMTVDEFKIRAGLSE